MSARHGGLGKTGGLRTGLLNPAHAALAVLAALAAVLLVSCSAERGAESLFVDVAAEVGLDFVHESGRRGELWYVEMMGAGCALFDADGDGDLDVWFAQGGPLDGSGSSTGDRYFQNMLVEEGALRFVDATAESGLGSQGYSMGGATGDFDGDGRVDLFVTAFGPDRLYMNRGGGVFEEVSARAGVADARWTSGATVLDFDRDGHLDLFVAAYVDFRLERHVACRSLDGRPDYCGPQAYEGLSDRLYRNRGDGSFEDVSLRTGIGSKKGAGLGVVAQDFDGDGWVDLFVANDGEANVLWRNLAGERFEDVALLGGVAVNGAGEPEASMGVACADLDGDGRLDLFVTHLVGETNTLYVGEGRGRFRDRTARAGLGLPSTARTAFGAVPLDVDGDGALDLLVVNGAVKRIEERARAGDEHPLDEPGQLFRNAGASFEDWSERAGPALTAPFVGRGVAVGDVDGDGDEDLLLTGNEGRARLLLRQGAPAGWIGVRTAEPGTLVELVHGDGRRSLRRIAADGSYLSASEPVARFALGAGGLDRVELRWPDGTTSVHADLEPGRIHSLERP